VTPITLGAYGLKIGDGPVYVISNDTPIKTGWGSWAAYKFGYLARKSGRVLLRARDLRTGQIIVFADNPLGPSAITATGSALGTDQLAGKTVTIRSEAISKDAIQVAPNYNQATLPYATVMIGEKGGGSGCVGLQFDGPDFTENVVIRLSGHGL
jgi:hypothetical protein